MADRTEDAVQQWRGARLGLPADGVGAVGGFGRRVVALFIDWLPCVVLAQLITRNPGWSALMFFAALTVISLTLAGRTPGQAAVGLRVARLDGLGRPGFGRAVVRTLLLCAAVPALLSDVDGRGLHDRATGTVVLRTR